MQCAILSAPNSIIEEEPEELPQAPRKNANSRLYTKVEKLVAQNRSHCG